MSEILIKVNVSEESKERFKLALAKLAKELSDDIKVQELYDEEDKIRELSVMLGRKVNKSLHERYKKLYPKLELK